MNRHLKLCVAIIVALICILFTDQLHAGFASPPPQLSKILDDFSSFESKFKAGRWDAALKSTDRITATFNAALPQLKKDFTTDPEVTFLKIMTNLKQSVRKKDQERTQAYFIDLHNFIFALIGNYEYKVDPLATTIKKYIAEAEEAIEKNDFNRVESEMEEIGSLYHYADHYLDVRKVSPKKRKDMYNTIQNIRTAGSEKQKETAQTGIHALNKMATELFSK